MKKCSKSFCVAVFITVCSHSATVHAQYFNFLDARSKGLAGISATTTSSAYVFLNNPANLALYRRPVFSINVNQFFEYNQVAIADLFPRIGVLGLAVGRLSDFNNTDFASLGYGKSFYSGVNIGVSSIVYNTDHKLANTWFLGVSFYPANAINSNSKLIPKLRKFVFAANLQNAFSTGKRTGPPVQFNLGVQYQMYPKLLDLFVENQFRKNSKDFIIALEVHTSSFTTFRSGISNFSKRNLLFGFGLNFKNFLLDVVYNKYLEQFQLSGTIQFGESALKRAAQYFTKGNELLHNNLIQSAIIEYNKALTYDPFNKSYRDRLTEVQEFHWELKLEENKLLQDAKSFEKKGEYLAALVRYMDISDRFPENALSRRKIIFLKPLAQFQLADVKNKAVEFYEKGELKYAQRIFDRLSRVDSTDTTVLKYQNLIKQDITKKTQELYDTGIGYLGQKKYENAYVFFKQILDLAPDYPQVLDFIDDIEKKMEIKNKQIDSLFVLAQQSENSSSFESAIKLYDEILKIDRENEKAMKALAILKPRVDVHVSSLLSQAQNAFRNKNYFKTENICRNILRIDRNNRQVKNLLNRSRRTRLKLAENYWQEGEKLLNQKKFSEAVEKFKKATSFSRSEQKYKRSLQIAESRLNAEKKWQNANKKYKEKNFKEAEKQIIELIEEFPDDKKYQNFFQKVSLDKARFATILLQEGIRLYSQEKYAEAVEKFKQILAIDKNNQNAKQYKDITEEKIRAIKKLK